MLFYGLRVNQAKTRCSMLIVIMLPILAGCAGGGLGRNEAKEPTDYVVYSAEQFGPWVLSHYLLPEHEEVQAVTGLVNLFAEIDQTQHWADLDWSPLLPYAAPWYHVNLHNKSFRYNYYVRNKMETRFEDLEIETIQFLITTANQHNPGVPTGIFEATVKAKVFVSMGPVNAAWQATYQGEFRLKKYNNVWKVDRADYRFITP